MYQLLDLLATGDRRVSARSWSPAYRSLHSDLPPGGDARIYRPVVMRAVASG
jgi:hypothetical protein